MKTMSSKINFNRTSSTKSTSLSNSFLIPLSAALPDHPKFTPKSCKSISPSYLTGITKIFQQIVELLLQYGIFFDNLRSSAKKHHPKKPLGSTLISIFDENDSLRQGKYHLFIWPNVLPDHETPTTTPGLTNDPNIQTLNFLSDQR